MLEISKKHDTYPKDLYGNSKDLWKHRFCKVCLCIKFNISFITSKMNKEMFNNRKSYNELIFAPIDHAFGLGRMHSIIKSDHSMTLIDDFSFNNFTKRTKLLNMIFFDTDAKLLKTLIELDFANFKKEIAKLEYAQVSTGYFPKTLRKKFLKNGSNLFINYGMTEAMRYLF